MRRLKGSNPVKELEEYGLTLYDTEGADLLEAYGKMALEEMALDELAELGGLAADLPICRTLSAAVRAVSTFRDMALIKKWIVFQKEFSMGKAPEEEISKRKNAAKKREKWIMREIELLLTRIDSISDQRNAEILARVYLAYLNRACSWEQFEEIAQILERFMYADREQLLGIRNRQLSGKYEREGAAALTMFQNNHCDRLVALGLVWQKMRNVLNGGIQVEYHLTEAGRLLAECL